MLLLLAVLLIVAEARKFPLGDGFWFDVNEASYSALSDSQLWLAGAPSWLGNVTFVQPPLRSRWSSGSDAIGPFEKLDLEYGVWSNSFRMYADCVVFSQHFPQGLAGAKVFDGPTPCSDQDCRVEWTWSLFP